MSVNCDGQERSRRHSSNIIAPIACGSTDRSHIRSGVKEDHTASYFSHDNPQGTESRDRLAQDSLEMLIKWLKEGGNVGIHGAKLYSR